MVMSINIGAGRGFPVGERGVTSFREGYVKPDPCLCSSTTLAAVASLLIMSTV